MMFLSRAESSYLHQHLSVVRHVTLNPEGPGVLRIHLLPCKKARRNVPFVALLNGQDILPLSVSWAILLAGLMDALQPFEGKEITEDQWAGIAAQAVETTAAVYPKTAPDQIRADLNAMLTSFRALAAGQELQEQLAGRDDPAAFLAERGYALSDAWTKDFGAFSLRVELTEEPHASGVLRTGSILAERGDETLLELPFADYLAQEATP